MRIYFSPIFGLQKEIKYDFSGDSISTTIDGISDTFDFTGIPDGTVDYLSIESDLPLNPIAWVEKIDGILYVQLMNPIPDEATEFQRFPEWIEVREENGKI